MNESQIPQDQLPGRTPSPASGGEVARSAGGDKRPPAFSSWVIESISEPWYRSVPKQIREMLSAKEPEAPLPRYRAAEPGDEGFSSMVLASVHEPWYRSLVASLRSSAEEKKLPPLKLTARPVAVKSIWGAYDNKKSGVSSSLIAHCAFVTAVFLLSATPVIQNALKGSVTLVIPVDISAYVKLNMPAEGKAGGGGGGGLSSPLAASKGKRPRFAMRQFAPPTPVPVNENPKLSVEPTLLGPPQLQVPNVDMAVFGDPLAAVGPPSAGPGFGGGIGTGRGTGIGSGKGGGFGPGSGGGAGGGVFRVGGGVSAPRLVKKIEPEYSEEARKAKYQGTVVLAIEVWEDGRAHAIRVIRTLGLGLDEKAIEAVVQWRFIPGKKDRKPVRVAATIEVNFRLL